MCYSTNAFKCRILPVQKYLHNLKTSKSSKDLTKRLLDLVLSLFKKYAFGNLTLLFEHW